MQEQFILRQPAVAGVFYPGDSQSAREAVVACFERARKARREIVAPRTALRFGLVPHAGWVYSGVTAATTFDAIAASGAAVQTVIVLGAVHRSRVQAPALYGPGAWATPLGDLAIDDELTRAISGIEVNPAAHAGEHAIEVQLPFIQVAFPAARFVPIAVTPDARAIDVGESVAAALRARDDVVVVASSDLTHYGPSYDFAPHELGEAAHAWAKDNDSEVLDAAARFDATAVLRHAAMNQSACGPGALAALVVAAKQLGATRAEVLAHTTSHEVANEAEADPRIRRGRGEPTDFVGYASVVFA